MRPPVDERPSHCLHPCVCFADSLGDAVMCHLAHGTNTSSLVNPTRVLTGPCTSEALDAVFAHPCSALVAPAVAHAHPETAAALNHVDQFGEGAKVLHSPIANGGGGPICWKKKPALPSLEALLAQCGLSDHRAKMTEEGYGDVSVLATMSVEELTHEMAAYVGMPEKAARELGKAVHAAPDQAAAVPIW